MMKIVVYSRETELCIPERPLESYCVATKGR